MSREEYTVNHALRDTLDASVIASTLSYADLEGAMELMLGRPVRDDEKGTYRRELQRNGHRPNEGQAPRLRVLFGSTENGLCPEKIWSAAGGDPTKRKAGYFVIVPEPSPEWVWWWKSDEERADDSEASDGADLFGRPRTGIPDDVLNAQLAALKNERGSITLAAIAERYDIKGSTPRDQRNRCRVYGGQTMRFQSVGKGEYWDVLDPATPRDILTELRSRLVSTAGTYLWRTNRRFEMLAGDDPIISIDFKFNNLNPKTSS